MLISLLRSGSVDFFSVLIYIASTLLSIFLVLPLHEVAHGFVAYKLGDSTAKNMGRLTLNPIAHIDYVGAALMLIIGFGWAKAVPVNSRNFKNPKRDMAITAFAGPLANLLAAIVAGLLYNTVITVMIKTGTASVIGTDIYISNDAVWLQYVLLFFSFLTMINIGLAVFNLVPIPPLDGSKILMAFLPDRIMYKIYSREREISFLLFILIMAGGVGRIISPVQSLLFDFIKWVTQLPFSWAW